MSGSTAKAERRETRQAATEAVEALRGINAKLHSGVRQLLAEAPPLTEQEWERLERGALLPSWVIRELRADQALRRRQSLAVRHALAGYPLGRPNRA